MAEKDDSNASTSRGLYLVTSAAELEAMREPTAGVDLMSRHHLKKYDGEARKTLRRGIAHFLSPQLQVLIREKPRIALSEKADFAELLSEEPSGRPIQELSVDLLRRSFMIRRRVVRAGEPNEEEDTTGPPIPPDLPMAEQTTNKLSSAFSKKVSLNLALCHSPRKRCSKHPFFCPACSTLTSRFIAMNSPPDSQTFIQRKLWIREPSGASLYCCASRLTIYNNQGCAHAHAFFQDLTTPSKFTGTACILVAMRSCRYDLGSTACACVCFGVGKHVKGTSPMN